MRIGVVGTGYVGLVTGSCFAEMGNEVTCVDIDTDKITQLQAGKVPIHEPGLDEIVERNLDEGRLQFSTDLEKTVVGSKAVFLALPTPSGERGEADLSYILKAAEDIGRIIVDYTVIVDKSTVPVGTTRLVYEQIAKSTDVPFDVVSNPEFLREGSAVKDFMHPDRVVIGTSSEPARDVMEHLYSPFVRQGNPIIYTDEASAELAKYAANAYLAQKISFMNVMSRICEAAGADVESVRRIMGTDTRIGNQFLYAGIGWGGSCFPKDVKALVRTAEELGVNSGMLEQIVTVNEEQKKIIPARIKEIFGEDLSDKKFALWGLSFKPHTDDIREAPSLEIIRQLTGSGAAVVAYDPQAIPNVESAMPDNDLLSFAQNPYDALAGVDALIIATEWESFRTPDFSRMKALMKGEMPMIFDGRNVFAPEEMDKEGFYYQSIGRRTAGKGR